MVHLSTFKIYFSASKSQILTECDIVKEKALRRLRLHAGCHPISTALRRPKLERNLQPREGRQGHLHLLCILPPCGHLHYSISPENRLDAMIQAFLLADEYDFYARDAHFQQP